MILTGASLLLVVPKDEVEVGPRNTDHCMREFLSEKLIRNFAKEAKRKPNTHEIERTRTVGVHRCDMFSLRTTLLSCKALRSN